MRIFTTLTAVLCCTISIVAQKVDLPVGFSQREKEQLLQGDFVISGNRGIETPPPYESLRAMAEWEEIQALTISWTSYPGILKQIVREAKTETRVIILSENVSSTENYLMGSEAGGPLDNMDNVTILDSNFDSVWIRDYAGNPVYGNEVDNLVMVDWIYNRPNRPNDDASPEYIADELGIELYTITEAPADLVNTGGNFMSDGFGTAFASELILDENDANNPYDVTSKTAEEIDQILSDYMGIDRYIKMETLPYDDIHHIDMHMKLLDEETLLVGQFPEGESDGPQLNANIEYVLSNFNSKWGTPYKIIWMPMVPNGQGEYAPDAYYRTFTNAVFVNKKVLLPTYNTSYDPQGISIWEEALPGYEIVGIDCDNNPEVIIAASGAIHCITHAVGVEDPLLISHQPLPDTEDNVNGYTVNAYMNHRDGVANGTLYWKTVIDADYTMVSMSDAGSNIWTANIPAQEWGTTVYYYVRGEANTGKVQVRPMPAPEGYWSFDVLGEIISVDNTLNFDFGKVYPNPANAMTVVPVLFEDPAQGSIYLLDILGQKVFTIYQGEFSQGEKKHFFDARNVVPGLYNITIETESGRVSQKLIVR
ncbi:MAG: agmatine deiminase family protein [Flavobacteriales bacterium]|nr:agmatine deiminase family protein [Flavobacteriales bacterium]